MRGWSAVRGFKSLPRMSTALSLQPFSDFFHGTSLLLAPTGPTELCPGFHRCPRRRGTGFAAVLPPRSVTGAPQDPQYFAQVFTTAPQEPQPSRCGSWNWPGPAGGEVSIFFLMEDTTFLRACSLLCYEISGPGLNCTSNSLFHRFGSVIDHHLPPGREEWITSFPGL